MTNRDGIGSVRRGQRSRRAGWGMGIALCLLAAAAPPAYAQDGGDRVYEVAGVSVPLPAEPRGSLVWDGKLYVALGAEGVAVFRITGGDAQRLEIRPFDGEAFDVALVGGRPWVMLNEARAIPLGGAAAASAPLASQSPGGASSPQAAAMLGGEVLGGEAGLALIDGGRAQGLQAGDSIQIFVKVPVEVDGIEGGAEGLYRETVSGVGRVEVLGEDRSQVALYRGGRAAPGDRYEVAPAATRPGLVAPNRLSGFYEAGFDVRPFLAVGTLGVGTLNEAWFSWVDPRPWFVDVRLQPLTAGWSRTGNLVGLSATAVAGYDNRFFAIGLGLGETWANTGVTSIGTRYSGDYAAAGEDDGAGYDVSFEEVHRGGSAAQLVRLGARDGFHLEVRNTFVLGLVEVLETPCVEEVEDEGGSYCQAYGDLEKVDEYREFRWGSTLGRLVVPVVDYTDLVFEGGGGATGFVYGAGGVQTWVRGNGDRGSLGLRVSAGYGLLAGDLEDEYINLRGPLLSFGMRWRI